MIRKIWSVIKCSADKTGARAFLLKTPYGEKLDLSITEDLLVMVSTIRTLEELDV